MRALCTRYLQKEIRRSMTLIKELVGQARIFLDRSYNKKSNLLKKKIIILKINLS